MLAYILVLHVHACMHTSSIKCFLKLIHYFIAALLTKRDLNKQNKMSNMNTEKEDLEQSTDIDHSFTFTSKVSNIVDDYLFNKEITKSGLKRNTEPENIVGTKKSKKRLRRL